MKKIFTFIAALATVVSLQAATVNWTVEDLGWTKAENNAKLDGETLKINDNLSLTFSNGEGTSDVIYRLTTNDQAPYIAFYSKNVMTVNAENATINSITFVVDQDADNALTTQSTPGWSVKVGGSTFNIDVPTWAGDATSVAVNGNSKTSLLGLTIDYTPSDGSDGPSTPEPGEETSFLWSASDLSELSNNDALDGMSFDINKYISFSLADNDSDKDIIFKKTSSAPTTINIYSKGSITFTAAEGVNITSIKFIVNTDQGTSNTPGWTLQDAEKNSYAEGNDTWTGNASEVTFTDKSAIQLMGLEITYTLPAGDDNGDDDGDDEEDTPGTGMQTSWLASELSELSNNDALDGMSFDINDRISFSLADNDSDKDIIFKKTSSAPTTINIYSKGSITFTTSEGTLLNSIKFIVNTDEGTSNTPGWTLQDAEKNSYDATNDTWTGNASEVTFTDKSAVQLKGLEISYTTTTGVSETMVIDLENAPAYDLSGRRVSDNYKGIVIQNGKKVVRF